MVDQMAEPIAHHRQSDGKSQPLWEHLQETSDLCGKFARAFGLQTAGKTLGWLHDLGKCSSSFQNYIRSVNGLMDPDSDNFVDVSSLKGKIDHSSAGAQIACQILQAKSKQGVIAGQFLSLCLASHHSGLIDCLAPDGTDAFSNRMAKDADLTHLPEVRQILDHPDFQPVPRLLNESALVDEIIQKLVSLKEPGDDLTTLSFKQGLLIRALFSCLIDADRLSTADFEHPLNLLTRNNGTYTGWDVLAGRLDQYLKTHFPGDRDSVVNQLRRQISEECLQFSTHEKGVYQLTVPTGGGKTLASLRFAINHAAYHGMDRIIYVIPYTSIIDQNADTVRGILENKDETGANLDQVVLEHHSNLTPDEESHRQNLLAQNWDAPVVFTTQVQFLEALFGYGTSGARRMHQLANSVIIFDEIQTLPVRCIHLFNLAVRFLVQACGSTVILCTATQPLLDRVVPSQRAIPISPAHKIISDEQDVFRRLKRVEVLDRTRPGGWHDGEIANLVQSALSEHGNLLVVVNTKPEASRLFAALADRNQSWLYHLSTHMCPAHRRNVLAEVKNRLQLEQPVVCISTQLIEAGVDIDFNCVIRYLAGLDSIAQAAGRCNRNGKRQMGQVIVLDPADEHLEKLNDIRIGRNITRRILADFRDHPDVFDHDVIGFNAMSRFYQYYFFQRKDEMKYNLDSDSSLGREDNLFNLLSRNTLSVSEYIGENHSEPALPFRQSFQSAAREFRVIDSLTRGVVVPYGMDGRKLITDLRNQPDLSGKPSLLKLAQRYSINLFDHEFARGLKTGAINEIQQGAGIFYLEEEFYDDRFGWVGDKNSSHVNHQRGGLNG